MPTNPLDKLYNRFDESKLYDEHLFIAGRTLQSAELNEIQSSAAYKVRRLTDVLFKDGDIVRDASIVVNVDTGITNCLSGALYAGGAIRGVAPRDITIAVVGTVLVGVYLQSTVVTEIEDADLRDPAIGLRNYQLPGALRRRIETVWGFGGDGQSGDFYPVYTVVDGIVRSKEPPPELDAVTQAIARYDRDSAGGCYVVSGLTVAQSADVDGNQVYTVSEGRARVNGYAVNLNSGRRLVYAAQPDLRFVDSEPHISTGAAAHRVDLNHTPISDISAVHITQMKNATLVHGGFTGAQDALPDSSIVSIIAVNQGGTVNGSGDGFVGGTTYTQGVDYQLTSDKVDWSLAGAEITPGSTYKVIYECITLTTPTAIDATGFTVTGAVTGTQVLVNYNWMLPRIDRLALDALSGLNWIKGVSAEANPHAPVVSSSMLVLASVLQTWTSARTVSNDGVRVVPMEDLARMNTRMDYLAGLIAQNTLKTDATNRDTAQKKGMFVDPMLDDSLRDQGLTQTGAIVQGQLTLPVTPTVGNVSADIAAPQTLPYTLSPVLSQTLRTGDMQINPYMTFDLIPAQVALTPAVDRWTDFQTVWKSPVTTRTIIGVGNTIGTVVSRSNQLLSTTVTQEQTLRPIDVHFSVAGFGAGENLTSVTFDGIAVTPSAP